ncbi:retrovirus-related pol polyprotein from transposon TNT 1-94 [Tanacetum coccineum]
MIGSLMYLTVATDLISILAQFFCARKMENLNEVMVKELRSDNRTEFRNHKLEEFCDEKGISQNFSSPCTLEQNGVAKKRNRTLIEAARTMLNSAKLPKQFWGEAVNTACYTQNISIIVKRHGKTSYDVFRGRSPDISYFYVFRCLVHIHNHRDHLGKFDEKADDGFFLGYSLVAKAFRVTKGDVINFNENRSFPDDEFLEPRSEVTQCPGNTEYFSYIPAYENTTPYESPILQVSITSEDPPEFTEADNHPTLNEPDQIESADHFELVHIELVNIIGEPLTGITTGSRIKDSDVASASECLYVNFLFEMEPKKLIEPLEEEGWIISMQEELNQFKRNKASCSGYNQQEGIDYEKTFAPVARLEAIRIFLAYAAYMGFMVYHMDVKSAFLNGKISKEVYVQQPPGFESSEFPNHVCKFDKALYKLKQAPKAWYQANPKESYLVIIKRISRYLKGISNPVLWYPNGSGFDLKAYSDSDYAGCNLDRKSTPGGCQILGGKLVYWSAKKKNSVAMSSAEAEYVVPIFCDNTSAIAISNNPVLHFRTKHIDIGYHFIRDHILKGDIELHFVPTDLQLADIFTKPLAEASFTRLVAELGMLNIEKQVSDKKKALSDSLT